jgi:hypothetical protein
LQLHSLRTLELLCMAPALVSWSVGGGGVREAACMCTCCLLGQLPASKLDRILAGKYPEGHTVPHC